MVKNLPANAGDERNVSRNVDSIPGPGRSPGGGHGYSLQYSCLENFMDIGAWCAIVHGVTKSQTRLSNSYTPHTHTLQTVAFLPVLSGLGSTGVVNPA